MKRTGNSCFLPFLSHLSCWARLHCLNFPTSQHSKTQIWAQTKINENHHWRLVECWGIFVFIIVGGHRCGGQKTTCPLSRGFWGLESCQQACVESDLPAKPSQGICPSVCPSVRPSVFPSLPHCAAYECAVSDFANAPRGQRLMPGSCSICSLESWSLTEPGRVWQPESPTNSQASVTNVGSH